jgi:uncharacterized membrane protein YuzA (DUF378 family)
MVGGFKYLISQANPDKIESAKNTIINALVGLAIAIISSQTVSYVANTIVKSAATDDYGLPKVHSTPAMLMTVLQILFVVMGAVSLLIVTIAGFNMVLSKGEPQKVAKARSTIIYALVGLVVSIAAAAIVSFVLSKVI